MQIQTDLCRVATVDAESTRTTIIGLFMVSGRAHLSTGQLAKLGAAVGATSTNVKSHLTRMVADGSLLRSGQPGESVYAPSKRRRHVIDAIRDRIAESREIWSGEWLLVTFDPPADRSERDHLRRHLLFDGFRKLAPGAFARPAWPSEWSVARARRHAEKTRGRVIKGTFDEAPGDVDLNRLYGLAALERRARPLLREIQHLVRSIPVPREAFRQRMRIGSALARFLSEDPRLPPELWGPRKSMSLLARAYRRFEEVLTPLSDRYVREELGSGENDSPTPAARIVGAPA